MIIEEILLGIVLHGIDHFYLLETLRFEVFDLVEIELHVREFLVRLLVMLLWWGVRIRLELLLCELFLYRRGLIELVHLDRGVVCFFLAGFEILRATYLNIWRFNQVSLFRIGVSLDALRKVCFVGGRCFSFFNVLLSTNLLSSFSLIRQIGLIGNIRGFLVQF